MSTTLNETPPAPRPHLTIKPSSRWSALDLGEVWQFRDLLLTLATRDVKLRYRQTALGAMWVVLQPLMAAGITSFVFNKVAKLPTGGVPPFLFAFAGFLMWNAFSSTLSKASGSLIGNTQLVSKVYFPRLILPLSTVFSTLIDFAVSMGMMVVLMVLYHVVPHWGLLLLPVWLLLILMLSIGFGLVTAALTVSYRDVGFILPVLIQFLWYACPIAYSSTALDKVPHALRHIYFLNPLVGYFDAAHWSLLGTGHPNWGSVGYSAIFTVAVFISGAFLFKKMERRFADVI
jgi:lipopolysaccharide transport system permease protein